MTEALVCHLELDISLTRKITVKEMQSFAPKEAKQEDRWHVKEPSEPLEVREDQAQVQSLAMQFLAQLTEVDHLAPSLTCFIDKSTSRSSSSDNLPRAKNKCKPYKNRSQTRARAHQVQVQALHQALHQVLQRWPSRWIVKHQRSKHLFQHQARGPEHQETRLKSSH